MSRPVVTRTVVADEPLAVSWTSVPVLFVGAEISAIPRDVDRCVVHRLVEVEDEQAQIVRVVEGAQLGRSRIGHVLARAHRAVLDVVRLGRHVRDGAVRDVDPRRIERRREHRVTLDLVEVREERDEVDDDGHARVRVRLRRARERV